MNQLKDKVKLSAQKLKQKVQTKSHQLLKTVEKLDIRHLYGTWYVHGELAPNEQFQNNSNITTTFIQGTKPQQQQILEIIVAISTQQENNRQYMKGTLKCKNQQYTKFELVLGQLKTDFQIIDYGLHYEWMVVGSENRQYAWIYSKYPTISNTVYENCLKKLENTGFHISDILRIDQMVFPQTKKQDIIEHQTEQKIELQSQNIQQQDNIKQEIHEIQHDIINEQQQQQGFNIEKESLQEQIPQEKLIEQQQLNNDIQTKQNQGGNSNKIEKKINENNKNQPKIKSQLSLPEKITKTSPIPPKKITTPNKITQKVSPHKEFISQYVNNKISHIKKTSEVTKHKIITSPDIKIKNSQEIHTKEKTD